MNKKYNKWKNIVNNNLNDDKSIVNNNVKKKQKIFNFFTSVLIILRKKNHYNKADKHRVFFFINF
jgi:hypothetical protein